MLGATAPSDGSDIELNHALYRGEYRCLSLKNRACPLIAFLRESGVSGLFCLAN